LLTNGLAIAAWTKTNLGAWAATGPSARGAVPRATGPYEWEQLAADLVVVEPILAELRAQLATPDRDIGWNYDQRTPFARTFVEKRTIAQWLAAAHTYHLHVGDREAADAELTALLQITGWHAEDFTIVGQMIRAALGGLAGNCTWSALQAPGLTETQLAGYQAQWERLDLLPAFIRALEFERVGIDELFVRVRQGGESFSMVMGTGATGLARTGEQALTLAWRAFAAEGDELFYLRLIQGQLDALRLLHRTKSWVVAEPAFAASAAQLAVFDTWRGRLNMISAIAAPNFSRAFTVQRHFAAERELTLAALALERFHLRHQRYPAALVELVPGLLAAVPVDWMDGKPLRYRLNADGTFTLWSIGEDLKDDGGDPTPVAGSPPQSPFWERRDVVWPGPLP
jgi:hypothetical protein